MTEDDLTELMAEPPHGENHGWGRNSHGGWSSLGNPEEIRRQVFSQSGRIHGFAYGYRHLKCRCVECRAWKAASRAGDTLTEDVRP